MKSPPASLKTRAERFEYYLALLSKELNHADRVKPLRDYVTGLLLAGKRKSIEPIAGRIDPGHVCARHQSLHHFIAIATWNDRALLRVICQQAFPFLQGRRRSTPFQPSPMADRAAADSAHRAIVRTPSH